MRVLVIPDVHLKPWIFDRAESLLKTGKADRAVCLMDVPDDWDREFQVPLYEQTFDRIIAFSRTFPETLWCYGNHDVSYLWGRLESGYSPYAERTVISKLEEFRNGLEDPGRLAFVHRLGKVIFSHGGLSKPYVLKLNPYLFHADVDEVIAAVNSASPDRLWSDDSPLWLRPQFENCYLFGQDEYVQVVGHTPVEAISEKGGVISTDVFSTYRNGVQIGPSHMVVIESETGTYETVPVDGAPENRGT